MNLERVVRIVACVGLAIACHRPEPVAGGDDGDDRPAGEWGDDGDETTTDTGVLLADVAATPSCDLFAQDCPAGQKCNPAQAGHGALCVPIVDDPGAPGQACSWFGGAWSGFDTCELGSFCMWADDGEDGRCRPVCDIEGIGTHACGIDSLCMYVGGHEATSWATCVSRCDPRVGCEDDYGCMSLGDNFVCVEWHGQPTAGPGQECVLWSDCEVGYRCRDAGFVSVCAEYCSLGVPCSDLLDSCFPYYGLPDSAPPGLEDLGVCG